MCHVQPSRTLLTEGYEVLLNLVIPPQAITAHLLYTIMDNNFQEWKYSED